jgi:PilZ domain
MKDDDKMEQERRKFIRLDLNENVRALDGKGRDIGRVEKVGAGGMQIRLADSVPDDQFGTGSTIDISIVEPGNVQNRFKVEVRVCEGNLLGVQFLN